MLETLNASLKLLAFKLEAEGQPLLALKCLYSCLQQSPVPAEEIVVKMHIARILMDHTTGELKQATQMLQQAVRHRSVASSPRMMCTQLLCLLRGSTYAHTHTHALVELLILFDRSTWWLSSCLSTGRSSVRCAPCWAARTSMLARANCSARPIRQGCRSASKASNQVTSEWHAVPGLVQPAPAPLRSHGGRR